MLSLRSQMLSLLSQIFQYTLECFAMRSDLLTEKTKISSFILPEILVKNAGINKITP